MERLKVVLEKVDVKQKQILIETKLVEINLNKLKDIGFDYATGTIGSPEVQSITRRQSERGLRDSDVQFFTLGCAISGTCR
jgi:type II secretory pathway component GspD/PulD (secretin)